MNYKEQVIAQAIEAFRKDHNVVYPEAYGPFFARIFDCGYFHAKQEIREQMIGINATIEDMKENTEMLIAALKGKK